MRVAGDRPGLSCCVTTVAADAPARPDASGCSRAASRGGCRWPASARSCCIELVALIVLRWRHRPDKDFPRPARFVNALIETSLPGVIIFVLARHMEPQLVFGFWPPLLYFVFIVLSTLRLDFWLSLWTGAVAAVAAVRRWRCWLLPIDPTAGRPEETLVYHFSRSVMLMLAGVAAAIVARQRCASSSRIRSPPRRRATG